MATLDQIATSLRRAKDDRGAVVLLGAGCSKSAGIPLAGELMKEIEREFSPLPAGLSTYAEYMRFLSPGERRTLLAPYVDAARINWAHIALAQLVAEGYVQCVLTTNFDPLIVRACEMLGSFPAVYDVPSSKVFDPAEVVDPSIFYLHGQRTGFLMLNTDDEFKKNSLDTVFRRAGERRPWIVIGYSGTSDPVFEQLASYERFDYRLFWIGFRDDPPSPHVKEKLLSGDNKYADYVNGFDADSFFVGLAKKLGCFPPALFAEPLKHLRQVITAVNPFDLPGQGSDLRDLAVKQMERASQLLEAESGQRGAMANSLIVAGKYEQVLNEYKGQTDASDSIADAVAWAWVLKGLELMDVAEAEGFSPDGADILLLDAIQCDEEALKIRPQMAEAHFNWGYALGARSKLKSGDEARSLFEQARAKYEKARELDPGDYETPYNLGNLLGDRAEIVDDDEEAIALLRAAIEEYKAAWKIKGKDVDVLTNLAATLRTLADKIDDPTDALRQAYDAYDSALTLAPDDYDLLYGQALTAAALSSLDEKFGPFAEARFLELAYQHPTAEVFVDWGSLLYDRGKIDEAEHRWLKAEELEKGSAAYLLARLYAKRNDAEKAKKWLLLARETEQFPAIDDVKEEPDFESLRDLDWFKDVTR